MCNLQYDSTFTSNELSKKLDFHVNAVNNGKRQRNSTTAEIAHGRELGSFTAKSPPQDPIVIVIPPEQTSVRKLVVYPRTPDMIIPEDAPILPISNDQWVALGMTLPEEEYEEYITRL